MIYRRSIRFFFQRMFRGWDDSETWSLDYTLAKWIIPRLERFKEIKCGYPGNLNGEKEWDDIIDKIIWAFKWEICFNSDNEKLINKYAKKLGFKDVNDIYSGKNYKKTEEGIELFAKYYWDLWW